MKGKQKNIVTVYWLSSIDFYLMGESEEHKHAFFPAEARPLVK